MIKINVIIHFHIIKALIKLLAAHGTQVRNFMVEREREETVIQILVVLWPLSSVSIITWDI